MGKRGNTRRHRRPRASRKRAPSTSSSTLSSYFSSDSDSDKGETGRTTSQTPDDKRQYKGEIVRNARLVAASMGILPTSVFLDPRGLRMWTHMADDADAFLFRSTSLVKEALLEEFNKTDGWEEMLQESLISAVPHWSAHTVERKARMLELKCPRIKTLLTGIFTMYAYQIYGRDATGKKRSIAILQPPRFPDFVHNFYIHLVRMREVCNGSYFDRDTKARNFAISMSILNALFDLVSGETISIGDPIDEQHQNGPAVAHPQSYEAGVGAAAAAGTGPEPVSIQPVNPNHPNDPNELWTTVTNHETNATGAAQVPASHSAVAVPGTQTESFGHSAAPFTAPVPGVVPPNVPGLHSHQPVAIASQTNPIEHAGAPPTEAIRLAELAQTNAQSLDELSRPGGNEPRLVQSVTSPHTHVEGGGESKAADGEEGNQHGGTFRVVVGGDADKDRTLGLSVAKSRPVSEQNGASLRVPNPKHGQLGNVQFGARQCHASNDTRGVGHTSVYHPTTSGTYTSDDDEEDASLGDSGLEYDGDTGDFDVDSVSDDLADEDDDF